MIHQLSWLEQGPKEAKVALDWGEKALLSFLPSSKYLWSTVMASIRDDGTTVWAVQPGPSTGLENPFKAQGL